MESVSTTDLYAASWYLTKGHELTSCECFGVNGKPAVKLIFRGEGILEDQKSFLDGEAAVNLCIFRRAYGQSLSYVAMANKMYREQEKKV